MMAILIQRPLQLNDQRICFDGLHRRAPRYLMPESAFIISNVLGTLNGVKRPCQFRISDVGG